METSLPSLEQIIEGLGYALVVRQRFDGDAFLIFRQAIRVIDGFKEAVLRVPLGLPDVSNYQRAQG